MEYLPVIGFYTIWFTPFIFVYTMIGAMKAIKEERDPIIHTIACCISLMLIVIPILISSMF